MFDNNKTKICVLFKDDVGRSRVRSCVRSHDLEFRDHGVTLNYAIHTMSLSTPKDIVFTQYK